MMNNVTVVAGKDITIALLGLKITEFLLVFYVATFAFVFAKRTIFK